MMDIDGARKENHEYEFQFPAKLKELEIGSFLASNCLYVLPMEMRYLRLIGNFYSQHLENVLIIS
jgi:hypothetical protein